MAIKDFRSERVRVAKIIGSSSLTGTPWVQFYSASNASNYEGGVVDSNMLSNVGAEVGFFVSGSKNGRDSGTAGSVSLFGGDVVVSGTLYAEKQVVEVDELVTGSFSVSGSLFVSGSARIGVYGTGSHTPTFNDVALLVTHDSRHASTYVTSSILIHEQNANDGGRLLFTNEADNQGKYGVSNAWHIYGKPAKSGSSEDAKMTFYYENAAEDGTGLAIGMLWGDGKASVGYSAARPRAELEVLNVNSAHGTGESTILISAHADSSASLAFRKGWYTSTTAAGVVLQDNENFLIFNSGSGKIIGLQVADQNIPSLTVNGDGAVVAKQRLILSGGTYFEEESSDLTPAATNEIAFYAKDDSGVTKLYFRNSDGISEIGSMTVAGGWTDNGTTLHPTTNTDYVALGLNNAASNLHVYGAGDAGILIGSLGVNSASLAFNKGTTGTTDAAVVLEVDESLTIVNSGSDKNIAIKWTSSNIETQAMTFDATNKRIGILTPNPAAAVEIQVADAANDDGLLVDFNETGNYHALKIDSEAAYSAIQVSGTKAGEFIQDGSGGYGLDVSRNIAEAGSNPLVTITDSNASNTQTTLEVRQAGTGDILNLFDGVTEVLTVTDGGKVGIGPSSPSYKLDVETSTPGEQVIRGAHTGDNVSGAVIRLENTRGGGNGVGGDYIGGIQFLAPDGVGNLTQYAKITTTIKSPAATAEDGKMEFAVTADATETLTPLNLYGDMVHILSGGADSSYDESSGLDVAFYVSGSTSSKDTTTRGTAVFGGDLMVSGTIYDSLGPLANSGWQDDGSVIRLQTSTDKVAMGRTTADAKLDVQDLSSYGATILIRAAANNSGSLAFAKTATGATAAGISYGPNEDLLIFNSSSIRTIGLQVASDSNPSLKINAAAAVDSKQRLLLSGGTYFKETATDLTPAATNEVALYAKDDTLGVTKLYFRNSDGISEIPASDVAAGWTDAGTTIHPTTNTDFVALGRSAASAKLHVFDTGNFGSTILISAKANNSGSLAFSKGTDGATAAGISLGPVQDLLIYNSGSGKDINFQIAGETTPSLQISGSAAVVAKSRMILSGGVYFKELATALTPAASNEIALYAKDDSGVTKLYFKNSAGEQSIGGGWNDAGSVIHTSTTSDFVAIGRETASAKLHLQDTSAFGSTILITAAANNSGSLAFNKGAAGSTAAGISLGPTEDLLIFNSGSLKDIDFQVASQTLPSVKINAAGNLEVKLKSLVSGGMYFKELASGLAPQQNNELTLYAKDDGGVTKLYFSNSSGEQAAGGAFTMAGTEVYPNSAATTNVLVGGTTTAASDIILNADGSSIFNEQGVGVDFRVESNNKENALLVDGSEDRVLILSGGGVTSTNNATATDVAFYVSGSKGVSGTGTTPGVAVFGGDTVVSGALHTGQGTSGISTLNVYANVSGDYAATIDNDHGSSGHVLKLLTDGNGSASRILEMEDGDGDVLFRARADGRFGFGPSGVSSMGAGTFVVGIDGSHTADIAISKRLQHLGDSDTYMDFPAVDQIQFVAGDVNMVHMKESGVNTQVLILSGGGVGSSNPAGYSDTNFYVSGTIGSRNSAVRGTSVFGGDLHISGSLTSDGTTLVNGAGAATRLAYWADADTLMSNSGLHFNGFKLGLTGSADSATSALDVDRIYTGTTSNSTLLSHNAASGILLDYDVTGAVAASQVQKHKPVWIKYDSSVPSHHASAVVQGTGIEIEMTGSDAGITHTVDGININVINSDGTFANNATRGIMINAPAGTVEGEVNASHIRCLSQVDTGDYFDISVGLHGITQLTTKDAAAANAHLNLKPDGKVLILSGGGVTSADESTGTDVSFYVSGALMQKGLNGGGVAVFGGDTVVSGGLYLGARIYNDGNTATYIRPQTDRWRFFANNIEAIDINSSLSQDYVAINRANADVDFKVNTSTKEAISVDAATNKVVFLSGSGASAFNEAAGGDVSFYVSGSTNAKNFAFGGGSLFGGDLITSGTMFISGGLQHLYNAGSTLEFQSVDGSLRLKGNNTPVLQYEPSGTPATISINSDGTATSTIIKTNAKMAFASKHTTNTVYINTDTASEDGTDTSFWVSGSIGSKGTTTPGTAVFGGDVVISGSLRSAGTIHVTQHGFNSTSTNRTYLPFYNVSDYSSTTVRYQNAWVPPFNGKLKKVMFRPFSSMNGGQFTGSIHVSSDGDNQVTTTPLETVDFIIGTAGNETFDYYFTGSQHFSAGQWVAVAYHSPDGGPGANGCNITCVWELDTNSL